MEIYKKKKSLIIKCKSLKWAKINNTFSQKLFLIGSHAKWDDYDFITDHSCNFKLVRGKMCYKAIVEFKA
jgi:hypothetical protein